ncbi:hypothetical protein OG985_04785 [Streptomyces sp. NBC_00289]|uniref:hypothetical protein n=1 Tax=Streptomyces sp. NBC_00289 TaxID=2975703 RepID=UPI00324F9D16
MVVGERGLVSRWVMPLSPRRLQPAAREFVDDPAGTQTGMPTGVGHSSERHRMVGVQLLADRIRAESVWPAQRRQVGGREVLSCAGVGCKPWVSGER